jgi:hypothetical protein
MTEKDYLTLRGVALRGEHADRTANLAGGVAIPQPSVPVKTLWDELVGDAALSLDDAGDLTAVVTVPATEVSHLMGAPHLAVAVNVESDQRDVGFLIVCASATDPEQLPYRITHVSDGLLDHELLQEYHVETVVDERHDVEISIGDSGAVNVVYDPDKSHVEWVHLDEERRISLLNAVAVGFGAGCWQDLLDTSRDLTQPLAVLQEVNRVRSKPRW